MSIAREVLRPRPPRLGTITTGRGVERSGSSFPRPQRSSTLVWHTDSEQLAAAVQDRYGGAVVSESPTWQFDVVTDVREVEVMVAPGGIRQALERWRAAECLRRCDGVTMSMRDGKPVDEPCLCQREIDAGQDRSCTPSTVVPVLADLPVDLLGVWDVRSTSWGTAANVAGMLDSLALFGAAPTAIPCRVAMADRTLRDRSGQVREVVELTVTVATSLETVRGLGSGPSAAALPDGTPQVGTVEDAERVAAEAAWSEIRDTAADEVLAGLRDDYRAWFGSRGWEDLATDELIDWVRYAHATVQDATRAPLPAADPSGDDRTGEAPNGPQAPGGAASGEPRDADEVWGVTAS